jgi:alpha-ketoglutarate-dependent taurine dioxygenase
LRVTVVKLAETEWAILFTLHHIVGDGWSQELFFRDLDHSYSASCGKPPPAQPSPIQYADVVLAERRWLLGSECEAELQHWKRALAGLTDREQLPLDHPRPAIPTHSGTVMTRMLAPELLEAVHELSRAEGVTPFMTLLAAFQVLLHRWTGNEDVVVGTDVANRSREDIRAAIGLFVNQLVLRTNLSGRPTFRDVLRRVRSVTTDAFAHQRVPFDKLVETLGPKRDLAKNPLFQVMFILQTASAKSVKLHGMEVEPIDVPIETAPFDLTLAFAETRARTLRVDCRYKSELFDEATIMRLQRQLETLLRSATEAPDRRIDDLEILTADEAAEQHARKAKRIATSIDKLLRSRPREVSVAFESLVTTASVVDGQSLPLLIRPALHGVDASRVAAQHSERIGRLLQQHGALLFRGFNVGTASALREFTDALTTGALDYRERSSPRSLLAEGVFTSTDHPADQAIVLHNEQSYTLNWPMKILFACLYPASVGGNTPLADCRRVLARLTERTVTRFETLGVTYVRNYGDGMGLSWQEAFRTQSRSEVEAYCYREEIEVEWKTDGRLRTRQRRPAVLQHPTTGERVWFNHAFFFNIESLEPALRASLLAAGTAADDLPFQTFFGDGAEIATDVLEEIRDAIDDETVSVPWQQGDVLVVDNMLAAHGREPYRGRRSVAVTMAEPYRTVVRRDSA